MRVLDFHTHPWRPDALAPATRAFIAGISPAVGEHGDALSDPVFAAERLRHEGIEAAVVLPEHCPATSGVVRTETVLAHCAAAPDVLLPFASVDPVTDPDPAGLLRNYIAAGVRGLKLYPSYQFFYPNDPRAYPLYEACAEAGIPVLLHIGSSVIPGTRLKYCDPIHLDDVAVDFPTLPIVMAHGGRGYWHAECEFLALHHTNVWIDVAGLVPEQLPRLFPRFPRLAGKMIFGSDWPAMPRSPGANVATMATLGLEDAALAALLYGNAAALLGYRPPSGGAELAPPSTAPDGVPETS